MPTKLTKDFTAEEFNTPREPWPHGKDENRLQLAKRAQWLRDMAGVPGFITSAARSVEDNKAVGGAEDSQHMRAEAVDLVYPLVPLRTLAERALADVEAKRAPAFGQLIFYAKTGHVHISLPTLGARNGEILLASHGEDGRTVRYERIASAARVPVLSNTQAVGASVAGSLVLLGGVVLVVLALDGALGGIPS